MMLNYKINIAYTNFVHYNINEGGIYIFADRFKRLRKDHEYTQESLATIIGVEKSSIEKYKGKSDVILSNDVLAQIANLFEVSIDYLRNEKSKIKLRRCPQTLFRSSGVSCRY